MIDSRKVYNALKPLISIIVHQPKFASWLKETYSDVDVWDIYITLLLYEYDEPFFVNGSVNISTMEMFARVLPIIRGITSHEVVGYADDSKSSRAIKAYGRFIFSDVYELSHTFKMPIGKFMDILSIWKQK